MTWPGSLRANDVVTVIMGGGAGTRLFPLTKDRSKPAVPLAGKYRLVDIPISNCINSDLRRIFILTQFNSASLHRHIQETYRFDKFSGGFVEILAAQQTPARKNWYQGTADAVRQNLPHLDDYPHQLVLILSGDQLYRMNFQTMIRQHLATDAEVTVATIPVAPEAARAFGIMQVANDLRITRFVEKPTDPVVLQSLRMEPDTRDALSLQGCDDCLLASMGIYVFNRKVLRDALAGTEEDFGKHVIPSLIDRRRVFAFLFQGYWEDIGTIGAFYEANLDLCAPVPKFNFYDPSAPIFTHPRYLPASKVIKSRIELSVIADGCIINDAWIERSLIGVRSNIAAGATIKHSIIMGQDFYETASGHVPPPGAPPMGIGPMTYIERTIVDKNARIGEGVRISPDGKPAHMDGPNFYIRDGIVVIPKNTIIPAGTVI
ncbi:MAG: glucose-1-phosphate adenylyltransferase [Gemmatimonadota bacterium]